jgi:hypothetical protein
MIPTFFHTKHIVRIFHLLWISLIFLLVGFPQNLGAQCQKTEPAYIPGEILKYTVAYNWGFIWVDAGWVDFKVSQAVYNGKNVYQFDAGGSSYKNYDWLYKVREQFQTFLEIDSLRPLKFTRDSYEGGYTAKETYQFNYFNNKVLSFTETSKRPYRRDTFTISSCGLYDVISLCYYFRSYDLNAIRIHDSIPCKVIMDGEITNLYIRYLGKEQLTLHNKTTYNTLKFSALLVEGTIFKGGEDLFVWVTDDVNHVPVQVEAEILVGTVKAVLSEAIGTKVPVKKVE